MNKKIVEIQEEIQRIYVSRVDQFVVEGLERKGFKFENKQDLIKFIKKNCNGEHYEESNKTTFFVNDIPFLEIDHSLQNKFKICDNTEAIEFNFGFNFL